MVSVQEASQIIQSHPFTPSVETVSLVDAVHRVLAEAVHADRDLPPYDRVTMDGIAVAASRLAEGVRSFPIESSQRAGEPRNRLRNDEACVEVMTGTALPEGTDTVIRYEDLVIEDNIATVTVEGTRPGQNIHQQGVDARQGDLLVSRATALSPAEVAILASVGKATVRVFRLPTVAVISTGDELVAVEAIPEKHQIRQSNGYALLAALRGSGVPATLHHFPDDEQALETGLKECLDRSDALVITGGVSKGKFDYVPGILAGLKVDKLFHGVRQRPGKPFWFGWSEAGKAVFAFPGNPVSTFLCHYRYFEPWLQGSLGVPPSALAAVLAEDFTFENRLSLFLQVTVAEREGVIYAHPVPGGGSGDFVNLGGVSGFLELPEDRQYFKKGDVFPFIPFRKPWVSTKFAGSTSQ